MKPVFTSGFFTFMNFLVSGFLIEMDFCKAGVILCFVFIFTLLYFICFTLYLSTFLNGACVSKFDGFQTVLKKELMKTLTFC